MFHCIPKSGLNLVRSNILCKFHPSPRVQHASTVLWLHCSEHSIVLYRRGHFEWMCAVMWPRPSLISFHVLRSNVEVINDGPAVSHISRVNKRTQKIPAWPCLLGVIWYVSWNVRFFGWGKIYHLKEILHPCWWFALKNRVSSFPSVDGTLQCLVIRMHWTKLFLMFMML